MGSLGGNELFMSRVSSVYLRAQKIIGALLGFFFPDDGTNLPFEDWGIKELSLPRLTEEAGASGAAFGAWRLKGGIREHTRISLTQQMVRNDPGSTPPRKSKIATFARLFCMEHDSISKLTFVEESSHIGECS